MPTARIITRFPERAAALRKTLSESGYHVEVVSPESAVSGCADIEYDLEELPGLADSPAPKLAREFVFAPQIRALRARFIRPAPSPQALADQRDSNTLERAIAPLPEPPGEPSKTPSLWSIALRVMDRVRILGNRINTKLNFAQSSLRDALHQLHQRYAMHQAAAEEKRRARQAHRAVQRAAASEARTVRERQLAAQRDSERIVAERVRAEAELRLQEQRERETKRLLEMQAQIEWHRERARSEEQNLLETERRRSETEQTHPDAVAFSPLRRRQESAGAASQDAEVKFDRRRHWSDLRARVAATIADWRKIQPNSGFATTRQYAWRQAIPVSAGIALAFLLGWAAAISGAGKSHAPSSASPASQQLPSAAPVAAVSTQPLANSLQKPPSAVHKASTSKANSAIYRSRRQQEEAREEDEDVVVIHHYPGKSSLARNGKKTGVKTISDLEQD